MKLSTNRWAVKVTFLQTGKSCWDSYYGYTTKKEAQSRADKWNKLKDHKAEVIDRK